MKKLIWLLGLALLIIVGVVILVHKNKVTPYVTVASNNDTVAVLGQHTKSTNCTISGALPDPNCTPGATIPTATKGQICISGYSKSVRNVTTEEKKQVFEEYGISSHTPGQYEIDHLVSLELGGSNDIANLWPEAAEPVPGFHQKDQLENYLHQQVCSGSISLTQAQQEISSNWLNVYQQFHGTN